MILLFKDYPLYNFYTENEIAFAHGDIKIPELFNNKNIRTIVISHIHPAVLIKDSAGIKKEKYKCFLIGNYKKKKIIILPSFFSMTEGSEMNEQGIKEKSSQLIPKNKLKSFETYVIGEGKIYRFGKYKVFFL
jgi:metallophosphoesterase superfamily enzyme